MSIFVEKDMIINVVSEAVTTVAKGRIDGELNITASLVRDYVFNSVDIMDVLIDVQDRLPLEAHVDFGSIISDGNIDSKSLSVESIAERLFENFNFTKAEV